MKDKIYTLDCGKNTATLYDGEVVKTISHEDVLNLPSKLETGSTLVGEYAHFGCPRGELSRAQPFTEKELFEWYSEFKSNNITLKLFPQKSMPRASYSLFGAQEVKEGEKTSKKAKKSDEDDPKAIYSFLKKYPNASLMNPPKSFGFSKVAEEGLRFRRETNNILNWQRRAEPAYRDKEDENTKWFLENIEDVYSNLSESAREIFRFNRYQKDGTREGITYKNGDFKTIGSGTEDLSKTQVMSVLALLRHPKNGIRLREIAINGKKQMPGWKFIKKYVLAMSPFHFKGGVARSNIYYHGLKNYAQSSAKEVGILLNGKNRGEFNEEEDKVFI